MRQTRGRQTSPARVFQIVATPGSGNGRALATAHRLREALRARGHRTELEVFADLTRLARWAATDRAPFSLLICVGGDGTLDTAARAAVRRSVPLLAVSSGFGNLFARALRQPSRVDRALHLLEHGEVVHVDVGVRNGDLFLCQESFGFLADIQTRTETNGHPRSRWRRGLAYYQTALRHLQDTPLSSMRVAVDGQVVARDAVIVTVANVETYGPWLNLTPDASPMDGLLDVFVMRRERKRDILAALLGRQLRLPVTRAGALVQRGQHVSVTVAHRVRHDMEVMPHRLPVLVSSRTAEALAHDRLRAGGFSAVRGRQVA